MANMYNAISSRIENIKVDSRIRSDLGDIQALADDIKKNGLINPILVTDERILVAGERRLEAVKLLGWELIPTRITTSDDEEEERIRLEIAENEQRKDFTKEERVKYGLELERIERVKAKERQEEGINQHAERVVENFPQGSESVCRRKR